MHSTRIRFAGRAVVGVVSVLGVLGIAPAARANVYAAQLHGPVGWDFAVMGPLTLTYRLNEAASSVTIQIYRDSIPGTVVKTITGTTSYGLNSVQWDGTADGGGQAPDASDYAFRVIANATPGHTSWQNITPKIGPNEIGSAQYGAPQGVAVNRDPNSEFFGRVYVVNGESTLVSGNAGATAVGDGIFMLNNDLTFLEATAESSAAPANAALESDIHANTSPWRIQINPDNSDELVVGDFSDGYENVWMFNAAGTAVNRILDRTTTGPGLGSSQNHGNAIDAMLSGTGADRRLWVIDQDYDLYPDWYINGPDISVFYVGTVTQDYTGQPWEVINGGKQVDGADGRSWTARGFYLSGGALYVANQRAEQGGLQLALSRYVLDASGLAIATTWSLNNDEVTAHPVVVSKLGVPWNQTYAVAIDEAGGIGAAGRTGGAQVIIFDIASGNILDAFDSGGDQIRDMDFDAAGNLYTTNETDQHVRMWSPPDGPNGFTTDYVGLMNIGPGASPDCNGNSVPDATDISSGTSTDCNTNAIPDECDIALGTSLDLNGNGIPDECDIPPPVIYVAPADGDTTVIVGAINPLASSVTVRVNGVLAGTASPGGTTILEVVVPSLVAGQVVDAKQTVRGVDSSDSDPDTVTAASLGTTLICDNFEYADQAAFDAVWVPELVVPPTPPDNQMVLSTAQNTTPGGQKSMRSPTPTPTVQYRSKRLGLTGILASNTNPLVWSVNVYDEGGGGVTGVNQYADLNADPALDFFLAEIGLAANSLTGGPETHYQARMIGNGASVPGGNLQGWFHLDQIDGPTRSLGWHRFDMVFKGRRASETKGHYVDVYVDDHLAAKNAHINDDTTLVLPRIGSGLTSTRGVYIDDYCAKAGPVSDLAVSFDCNTNGVADFVDLTSAACRDCNGNGVPDECDIAGGSADCDLNGWPDSCDIHPGGQTAELHSGDGVAYQEFGYSISVDGDYAVIGVPRSGVGGRAYVFHRVGGTWIQQQQLKASDAAAFDQFGQAVSLSGNRILVGANGNSDAGSSSGSAYIFRRDGTYWVQEAKLTASNAQAAAQFGWSVSISGGYALVGAFAQDHAANDAGSVYVFHYSGAWTQTQVVNASDPHATDVFGWSVSVSGDYAIVGAMRDDAPATDTGAAYILFNNAGTWGQVAKLTAADAAAGDYFGYAVSMSGSRAVIGALGEDAGGADSGSAYVFFNNGGTWIQEAKLVGSDTVKFDAFANAVSIRGDYLVAGARGDDDLGSNSGSAYLFHRTGGTWVQAAKLTMADGVDGDQLGASVAVDGYEVFVGARGDDDLGSFSGSVLVFHAEVIDCNGTGSPDDCESIGAGDFDGDGDRDAVDLYHLVDCLSGPGGTPVPDPGICLDTCLDVFDLDVDGDVDLGDFGLFQDLYAG